MINDGGAERMVKNNKVSWYQIVAVIIMAVIMLAFLAFVYFTFNAKKVADYIDKTTLKDSYSLLKEVKENFEDIAVYNYEQKDDTVRIEFRYYEEVLEKKTDLYELSTEVREFITGYLNDNPEDALCIKKMKIDLRFPDIHYSNFSDREEFLYSNEFLYASYEYSDTKVSDFLKQAEKIKRAKSFSFSGTQGYDLTGSTDFSGLFKLEGLKSITAAGNNFDSEALDKLKKACAENNVELILE